MPIIHRRSWEIPESQATPEHIYMNRRALLGGAATLAASMMWVAGARADADPTSELYPAKRSEKYTLDRELTPENKASYYNNFYEYGTDKHIASRAQKLKARPWTVKFDGMVENEMTVGIDELIRAMPLEERLYRMRCVEAWSMAVPWTGFAMAKLVAFAKPLSSAKYVRMETFNDSSMAPEQRLPLFPWPYVEGLTMAEANNELTFMVTGIYGKPAVKQHGAPLRLITPWKYGFKGVKSIVRLTFTDQRPKGTWEVLQSSEYGFWANVNPAIAHPRWSQATETDIGTGDRRPTLIYNGYGEQVANLYQGLEEKEKLFV
jgi:methionine sulfoxide reductase catalytic subunit